MWCSRSATGSTLWVGSTYIGDDDADSAAGWAIHQDVSASNPRVRIAVYGTANGASAGPTSADNTVSTATDTPYVFSAADFPFTANTSGDTVASVVVATRTANDTSYDKGRLRLDGNDFETPFTLTKADLDAGRLVYTPWTDVRGGRRYARSPYEESFRFWVNGGTRATATHRMTIDVSTSSLATVAPSVTGVEIEPEANNASWEEGEAVEATLTFDEAVTVDTTGGTPTVALTLGASTAEDRRLCPGQRHDGTGVRLHAGEGRGTVRFGVAHPEQPRAQRGRHPQQRERRGCGARPRRIRGHRRPDVARRGRAGAHRALFRAAGAP